MNASACPHPPLHRPWLRLFIEDLKLDAPVERTSRSPRINATLSYQLD